jgi:hypothetical protein
VQAKGQWGGEEEAELRHGRARGWSREGTDRAGSFVLWRDRDCARSCGKWIVCVAWA